MSVCTIDGCGRKVLARGWCSSHYQRYWRYGDPLEVRGRMIARGTPLADRLAFYSLDPNDRGCRLWTGAAGGGGYGTMQYDGISKAAHVWALELKLGRPLSPGLMALHSCDVPLCITPEHLREGTNQDNMDDKVERGRQAIQRGDDAPNRKVCQAQVDEIRCLVSMGHRQNSLAARFGISTSEVSLIVKGERWITEAVAS